MSALHFETREDIGAVLRARLAGFVRSLRDSGFKVGMAETSDALRLLQTPLVHRQDRLKASFRTLFADVWLTGKSSTNCLTPIGSAKA